METVSENRRGRPRVMPPETEAAYASLGLFADVHSERSKLNIYYRTRTLSILDGAEFSWLFDRKACQRGEGKWKPTILSELGRIEDEEDMKAVARQICELKPKTKEAVTMIRRFRLGRDPEPDAVGLANEIIHLVNDYLQRYPAATKALVGEALGIAQGKVDECLGDVGQAC